jgi:UDP-4-amino-4,6-dideoxy-N-acetyl-beta-L-altrosamine transaminase
VKRELPFFVPWVTEEDKKAVLEVLDSRWLTGGPRAKEFEKLFTNYTRTKYSVSVNSCTAALHLAMRALDIGPGDEVIVPVLTFAATANAPLFVGAKPVFADVDEKTFNISPKEIEQKITKKTKAMVVVHYGGQPCDMKEIMEIAEDHNVKVVEDCAHALGALYQGKNVGTFGAVGCFSFYPTKIITTIEGGMATTQDKEIASKMQILREHGMTRTAFARENKASWYYDVVDLGYNYRMNEVQAALGISQLKRIDEINEKREEAAKYYTKRLSEIKGIITPYEAKDRTHLYHLYAIRVLKEKFGMDRNDLFKNLSASGIGTSVHYTPLHFLTFYKKLGYGNQSFPVAERVSKEILTLPLFPTISKLQINFVAKEIEKNQRK